jgi:adenylate cyclase
MGVEIERKFLVFGNEWRRLGRPVLLRQGYLSADPERTVRVRIEGTAAMLTVKSRSNGATRGEWEYPIPLEDAQMMLDHLCNKPLIEKYRSPITYHGMIWEIDEFLSDNAGLLVAEIELTAEDQVFAKPDWVGEEVTHDARYFNSNLVRHPYSTW